MKTKLSKKSVNLNVSLSVSVAEGMTVPRLVQLSKLTEKVLLNEKANGAVNLVFCDNNYIRKLNREFRKLDKATDVLSFYYGEPEIFGEIYISAEKAKFQAPRWNNSYYKELKRLCIHGALHLCGYDHLKMKERKLMLAKEEFYLK